MDKGKLYLIPTILGEGTQEGTLPSSILKAIQEIDVFIVENFSSKLCKTLSNSFSIKSGKRLTQEEMRLLIVELLKCDTPSISPFGLNSYFNIKTEEINKKFNK